MSAAKLRQHTKTPLMAQQVEALRRSKGQVGFGLLMEQGTGKTLTLLEEALRLYASGEIDRLLVLAPNGVHENWILSEIPNHIPPSISIVAAYYRSPSAANLRERAAMGALWDKRQAGDVPPLRVLAISYDSILALDGFKYAERFANCGATMIVADESQFIKGPDSSRTKRALRLSALCNYRRIATGTAITNSPIDAFSQFAFLEPGCLGTESIVVFRRTYCELLPIEHGTIRNIVARREAHLGRKMSLREKELYAPQLVKTDEFGRPMYKNLDQLRRLIALRSYRVLKEECMDLPPKMFETRYFHLNRLQRTAYDRMEEEFRYTLEDGSELITAKLVAMGKLRQITSGFLLMRDGGIEYLKDNPRIELLSAEIEGATRQGIIWAEYKESIANIRDAVRALGMKAEVVNGDTPMKDRRAHREAFQAGDLQWIVAHPGSMGTGYTLTAAEEVIYYENGFNLGNRLQSEDRAHRIGQKKSVRYRDLVAIDTRDDNVVWALQHKLSTAEMIQGDPSRNVTRFSPPEGESPSSRRKERKK